MIMATEDWEQVRSLLSEGRSIDEALGSNNTDGEFDPSRLTIEGLCDNARNRSSFILCHQTNVKPYIRKVSWL